MSLHTEVDFEFSKRQQKCEKLRIGIRIFQTLTTSVLLQTIFRSPEN